MALNVFDAPSQPVQRSQASNFRALADKYDKFGDHVTRDASGRVHLDFKGVPTARGRSRGPCSRMTLILTSSCLWIGSSQRFPSDSTTCCGSRTYWGGGGEY